MVYSIYLALVQLYTAGIAIRCTMSQEKMNVAWQLGPQLKRLATMVVVLVAGTPQPRALDMMMVVLVARYANCRTLKREPLSPSSDRLRNELTSSATSRDVYVVAVRPTPPGPSGHVSGVNLAALLTPTLTFSCVLCTL